MSAKKIFLMSLVLSVCHLSGIPTEPMDVIRHTNQQVQDIFRKNPTLTEAVEAELHRVIDSVTDYNAISQSVIQRFCQKLSPSQCREFNTVFTKLLRTSSIKKLGRYRADRFEYIGQNLSGNTAEVQSFAFYKNDRVQLNYHLKKMENRWMIVNYVVDDVDTIRNYKKQFLRLFARYEYPEIITRLRRKISQLEAENREQ